MIIERKAGDLTIIDVSIDGNMQEVGTVDQYQDNYYSEVRRLRKIAEAIIEKSIPMLYMSKATLDKETKTINLPWDGGSFPKTVDVVSDKTGVVVRFQLNSLYGDYVPVKSTDTTWNLKLFII